MLHSVKIRYMQIRYTSYMQNDHNFTYAVYALMFLITFFLFSKNSNSTERHSHCILSRVSTGTAMLLLYELCLFVTFRYCIVTA